MSYHGFAPYESVAKRRERSAREIAKLRKKGQSVSPVVIEGGGIAKHFWGKAWCENLERYSDYENRLPRGRAYARNGSVIDLQIESGQIRSMVMGSSLYRIKIDIGVVPQARWQAICKDCAGSVGSLVELLSGKLSKNVMERVCRKSEGLFPAPGEIKLSCSCLDGASMCKHVAATLYGVGARLDASPDLIFALRGVDSSELFQHGGVDLPISSADNVGERILVVDDLAAMFGIEMASTSEVADAKLKVAKAKSLPGIRNDTSGVEAIGKTADIGAAGKNAVPNSAPKNPNLKKAARKTAGVRGGKVVEARESVVQVVVAKPKLPRNSLKGAAAKVESPPSRRVRAKAVVRREPTP